jgi:transcription antitermination factor NusG
MKKNKSFIPKVEDVEAEYWRRRALKKDPKKRKEPEVAAEEAQKPVFEDQVEDVDEEDEIRHEADDGEIVSIVPEPFEKFGGEFSLADLTIFLMRLPRAVLQILMGLFR